MNLAGHNPDPSLCMCMCMDCRTRRGEFDAGRTKELKAQAIYDYVDEVKDQRDGRPGGRTYDAQQETVPDGLPNSFTGGQDFSIAQAKGAVARKEAEAAIQAWAEELKVSRPDVEVQALRAAVLSTDPVLRKEVPIATCVIDYFPLALAAVAAVSLEGQKQHGTTGWDRSKSADESDALMRHFVERGTRDTDGHRHSAKVAWRALALLQKELEADRA